MASLALPLEDEPRCGTARRVEVRVRGRVQGVGFRPTVWRYARELGLDGEVLNDGDGVLIRLRGDAARIDALIGRLRREPPPLARIESIVCADFAGNLSSGFAIAETVGGAAHTQVAPDAALCAACAAEVRDPAQRRQGYAFTNCTHCGPRLSIVEAIPYDRAATSMRGFPLCDDCLIEYRDPGDRRFHAEAIACPTCGPRVTLVELVPDMTQPVDDPIRAASELLSAGAIVAVKGLGGYQLACDATNAEAVARLRAGKHRDTKPFALMARDPEVIRRYCTLDPAEATELASPRAPILLLSADGAEHLPKAIAPGLDTLGFMLPTTPLHLLLLEGWDRPLVMTSGNVSGNPQIIDDAEARAELAGIASHALMHDRPIANRVDDSVVRVMRGRPRVLRRARGFAPAPVRLPEGFEAAPEVLALGGELKATFAMVKDGEAILSQHIGDLEQLAAWDEYVKMVALYRDLFGHRPVALAADLHPDYLSAKHARTRAHAEGLRLVEVQHHHAHVAACLTENGRALKAPPVLGIALDGLGWGDDGTIWGAEFLLADYCGYQRLATFPAVPMPGGAAAAREPWRNLYAHLLHALEPQAIAGRFAGKPVATIAAMLARGLNSPPASSCGRLFDGVAAALGICFDAQGHEGEAAARLEAIADRDERGAYPFAVTMAAGLPTLDPASMWRALLDDLDAAVPAAIASARFHHGLAGGIVALAHRLSRNRVLFDSVALSGGCFQNHLLFEQVAQGLEEAGFTVLSHAEIPANDGGLAFGQAAVAAARLIDERNRPQCA